YHRGALGVRAGNFDRVFDGFRPGVDEESFLGATHRRQRVQFFSQRDVRLIRVDTEAGVQEFIELRAHSSFHSRRAVPNVQTADAAGKIQIAIAVDVLDAGAFGPGNENRRDQLRAARDGGFAARQQRL